MEQELVGETGRGMGLWGGGGGGDGTGRGGAVEGQCALCMSSRAAGWHMGRRETVLNGQKHFMDRQVGLEAREPSQEGRSGSGAGTGLMLPWREDFIVSHGKVQTAS